MIIITSDHGESLGEHHLYFNHIYTLFNEVIKVPLIIKYPRQIYRKLIQENAALVDVLPTIIKELGIKMIKRIEGVPLKGIFHKRRLILASNSQMIALISGSRKLIKYFKPFTKDNEYIKNFFPEFPDKSYQFFDIKNDPLELINQDNINAAIYQQMKHDLSQYENKKELFYHNPENFELDEDYKQSLKSLGYVQ